MSEVVNIIKHTLSILQKSKIIATPQAYEKEFVRQANKYTEITELRELKTILNNLSSEEKINVSSNDITTYYELVEILLNRVTNDDLSRFINHLREIMQPSLDKSIYDNIDVIIKEISVKPKYITSNKYIKKLKNLTKNRIDLDKNVLNDKTLDIRKIFSILGKYLNKSLIQSKNSSDEISKIKIELSSLELSNDSHSELLKLQENLINTANNLDNSIEKNKIELIKSKEYYSKLEKKILKLEKNLLSLGEERDTDFLTGVLNRRALQLEIEKFDNQYKRYDSQYAIVFYDLDHFKRINDEYGHDCGDTILKSFASLLKKLTRVDDIVSRYGGEEFLVLVHYKNSEEVYKYIKRVKHIMNKNSFVYNDILVKVRFSAGLSLRSNYSSYKDALVAADKYLYKAKLEGRDRIVSLLGTVE